MSTENIEIRTSSVGNVLAEVVAVISSAVPWIGGPVSAVLSGALTERKIGRIREVLEGVGSDLKDFKSEVSEEYVKTEDFEDLLDETLRQAMKERSEEKRRIYRAFLSDVIKSADAPYEEQARFLSILEDVQPAHLRILQALAIVPDNNSYGGGTGSPGNTLAERVPTISSNVQKELVTQLNDWRLTNLSSLATMMSSHGAENLSHSITPLGQRFIQFLEENP